MSEATKRLPRGRHKLSREQVEQDQRNRILAGMAESVRTNGYVDTPVAAVIREAGVSRETFYQLYDSKLECFLDAFELIGELLIEHLRGLVEPSVSPLEQFETVLSGYLETPASEPGYARLFLVEVYAAGPRAMELRDGIQARFVDALMEILGLSTEDDRFACRMLIAAVAAMVTYPLVTEDEDALMAIRQPILNEVRTRFGVQN